MPSTTTKRRLLGILAALAFTACAVCCLWAVFVVVFANGMFAGGDSHPESSAADLLAPLLIGMTSAGGGVFALVKRGGR